MGALFVPTRSTEALPSRAIKVTPLGKPTNHPYERFFLRFPGTAAGIASLVQEHLGYCNGQLAFKTNSARPLWSAEFFGKAWESLRSKINAEIKDPVVLVLWVSVADGKLVARSHGPG